MSKPLLTIGMIVKNEERCLEKCLKALQPLRDAVPCELIIADTGSDDKTWEIAEKYADTLFFFEWIKDFAAARNAVIEKATGEWYLTVDADEYLDEDISELVNFLHSPAAWEKYDRCAVIQRNYNSLEMDGEYGDFAAVRMARLVPELRYHGSIHEHFLASSQVYIQRKTVLHHDGYVGVGKNQGEAKRKRNLELLKIELENNPEDIRTIKQCMDVTGGTTEYWDYCRRAMDLIDRKVPGFQVLGPGIYLDAFRLAKGANLPEFREYAEKIQELFPDSIVTKISFNQLAQIFFLAEKEYSTSIKHGLAFMKGLEEYQSGKANFADIMHNSISGVSPFSANHSKILLAEAYLRDGNYQESLNVLNSFDFTVFPRLYFNYFGVLMEMYTKSDLELNDKIIEFWTKLVEPSEKTGETGKRKAAVCSKAAAAFSPKFIEEENKSEDILRNAYTLFRPLYGVSELGAAARILDTEDVNEMDAALATVEEWSCLPIHALARAIQYGADFPPKDRAPMYVDTLDELASGLRTVEDDFLIKLVPGLPIPEDINDLNWVRALILAAMHGRKWDEADTDESLALIHQFVDMERTFLPLCYGEVDEKRLPLLPPMHRFGWYLIRAFSAVEDGDGIGYVRLLRQALLACESSKDVAEFLIERFMEKGPAVREMTPELAELAENVRAILAAYPEDDPAVLQLKESEAYKAVAFILEKPEGLPQ